MDISQCPSGAKLLVDGKLNMYLASPEGNYQYKAVMSALSEAGLEDMSTHFLPCHTRYWYQ